jgi:hypothetical protein
MDARSRQGVPGSGTPLELCYRPRDVWLPFHESAARFRVVVAHRRAGKTVALINELVRAALFNERVAPRYAYIAPFLGQAKAIAWDYLKRFTREIPRVRVNESELRVDLPNGGRVRLCGADNPDALRGLYFDGIVLDEFGDMDAGVYVDVLRPTLSERGGWAVFAGTPRGKNAFYDYRERARKQEKDWAFWELKASATSILTREELMSARDTMDEHAYEREYECDFDASIAGAYYAGEMAEAKKSGRICRLPVEPTIAVDTAWDLGIDDATAIWFVQDVGKERRLIDYFETSGAGLPEIVKALETRGYRYRRHILPHDVEVRELGSGQSRRETLERLGLRHIEVVPRDNVADGINAVRLMLARCWFDEVRCYEGLECLKQYRRDYDKKRQTWKTIPHHDFTSHAADAFRYLALSRRPVARGKKRLVVPDWGIV